VVKLHEYRRERYIAYRRKLVVFVHSQMSADDALQLVCRAIKKGRV